MSRLIVLAPALWPMDACSAIIIVGPFRTHLPNARRLPGLSILQCLLPSVRVVVKNFGKNSAERKPLPKEPEADDPLGGKGSLEAQNEAATQVFNTESLEACANCGRTFLKER